MAKLHKKRYNRIRNQVSKVKKEGKKQNRFAVLPYPKPLATKRGFSTIYIRLSYNGLTKDRSTGIVCKTGEFNNQTRTIANDRKATLLLRDIDIQLERTFTDFRLTNRPINLGQIWQVALGDNVSNTNPNFDQLIELFAEQSKTAFEAGEISKPALTKQTTFGKHILAYFHSKYKQGFPLDSIVPADARALVLYCKTKRNLGNDYTMAVVMHTKRLLNYAVENEWISRNPFMNFRRKLNKTFGEVLTEKEVELLQNAELFSPTLDRVRNIFLLQCYTGLSYIDLKQATHSHIMTDEETGKQYIRQDRQKTKNPSIVPLINEAKAVINKYQNDTFCRENGGLLIPIYSNQKLNNYLKQLAGIVGIQKRLVTRVARRTCGTLFLNAGVPLSTVSTILGHTNTITTQKYYAKTNPAKAIKDVMKAKRRKAL